ncbi:MAG: helix-turn-helix domain-containing protein [Gemmatimonadota bacterium]|nr:MAG: helix-turn-helix domain-containing protein [Gemmatimonadota bacterium]
MSPVFSPLARAVLDSFSEGVVVFDPGGQLVYANHPAEKLIDDLGGEIKRDATALLPQLARQGGRIAPLRVGGLKVGEAVYLPTGESGQSTLADREREAILLTLQGTGWRLAESARRLGISRTTLWRRLKEYGLHRDGRGRWSQAS